MMIEPDDFTEGIEVVCLEVPMIPFPVVLTVFVCEDVASASMVAQRKFGEQEWEEFFNLGKSGIMQSDEGDLHLVFYIERKGEIIERAEELLKILLDFMGVEIEDDRFMEMYKMYIIYSIMEEDNYETSY